jgi:hypothetical protein
VSIELDVTVNPNQNQIAVIAPRNAVGSPIIDEVNIRLKNKAITPAVTKLDRRFHSI